MGAYVIIGRQYRITTRVDIHAIFNVRIQVIIWNN